MDWRAAERRHGRVRLWTSPPAHQLQAADKGPDEPVMRAKTTCTWPATRSVSAGVSPRSGRAACDAGHHLEQLAREMAGSANAVRPEIDLAGVRLYVGDEFPDRLRRRPRIHHHQVLRAEKCRDRA